MPRKRPETRRNKISKMLIEEYQPQSAQDLQDARKDLLGDAMEQMLKAELDEHLDYEYREAPLSINTRTGSSKKLQNHPMEISNEIFLETKRELLNLKS